MANKEILARVKHKRDTSSNWTQNNPVLLNGEIILVDTAEGELRAKIGDGTKTYTQLPFSDEALRSLINDSKVTVDDALSSTSTNPVQNKVVTTEINGIKTLVGDTSVSEQINTAAINNQSDWNVNDESSASFIKNKTHWAASITNVVFESSSVTFSAAGNVYVGDESLGFTVSEKNTYLINWDGVDYNCAPHVYGSMTTIGNASIINGPDETEEPFVIFMSDSDTLCVTLSTAATHSIVVTETSEQVHKIDKKYLPEPIHIVDKDEYTAVGLTSFNPVDITQTIDFPIVDLEAGDSVQIYINAIGSTTVSSVDYKAVGEITINAQVQDYVVGSNVNGKELVFDQVALINNLRFSSAASTLKSIILNYYGNASMRLKGTLSESILSGFASSFSGQLDIKVLQSTSAFDGLDMWSSTTNNRFIVSVDDSGIITTTNVDDGTTIGFATEDSVIAIDTTLTKSGQAADSKTTGDVIATKVDKVSGKGLSTEDYTTIEKTKLAGIEEGANKTTVDSTLSSTSENPVQNKVINTAINNLNTLVGDTAVSTQITTAISSKVEASDAITGLSVSGKTVTYTKGDGSTGTITTQDAQVNREPITTNADYPILLSRESVNSTVDTTAVINSNIKANPSEGGIYVKRLEVYGTAKADGAYAGGYGSFANNIYSFAHGQNASASNTAAFSHGNSTDASGAYSHAEGDDTTASGTASHAEGYNTTASSHYAHAEGYQTTAGGSRSHTEGTSTTTSGEGAHAEGYYTIAEGNYSHVQGKYNVADSGNDYAHIVGNGTAEDARSNAHTLDWDGNVWFAGNIKIGGTGYNDSAAVYLATVPKVTTVSIPTANWTGDTAPYSQVVTVNGVTANSKVDLQPTAAQILELQEADIMLMAENDNGAVTIYALGGIPTSDYTMQVLITEVEVI